VTLDLTPITKPTLESAPAADFADAMSALASGVALVTCWLDGRPWGMTVTAFASVSADPPTILVSLAATSASVRAIGAARMLGVSILGEAQLEAARHSSAPGAPKFLEPFIDLREAVGESPVIAGALAHLDCEVTERVEIADHTVFFARVREARTSLDGAPLVYFRRAYRTLARPTQAHPSIRGRVPCLSS